MKPTELILLRAKVAEQRQMIDELRKIGAAYFTQANELKGWLLVLLGKVGPQKVSLEAYDALGVALAAEDAGKGIVFTVTPIEDEPGFVLLSAGDLEKAPPLAPAGREGA